MLTLRKDTQGTSTKPVTLCLQVQVDHVQTWQVRKAITLGITVETGLNEYLVLQSTGTLHLQVTKRKRNA